MISIEERENLLQIVRSHLRRYPRLGIEDLYKLVFQAVFGGRHRNNDLATLRLRLYEEWKTLDDPEPWDLLVERIDPRGRLIRVNLRPFKQAGGTVGQMEVLFSRSIDAHCPDDLLLPLYWEAICDMAEMIELPFRTDHLEAFWKRMAKDPLRCPSHSSMYRRLYRPRYRVVLRRFWDGCEFLSDDESKMGTNFFNPC